METHCSEACITAFDGKTATVSVKNWKTFAVELGWSTSASIPPFRLLDSGQSIALLVDTSGTGPLVVTATSISRDSITAFALDILCSALPYCKTALNAAILLDQVVNGYVAQEFGRFVDGFSRETWTTRCLTWRPWSPTIGF
ncbi:MAG: hypothetical protein M5U18_08365 [Dehalococcoidia bacterium]|nr:hypothetical protein [Dehalococcoidia bacterium]